MVDQTTGCKRQNFAGMDTQATRPPGMPASGSPDAVPNSQKLPHQEDYYSVSGAVAVVGCAIADLAGSVVDTAAILGRDLAEASTAGSADLVGHLAAFVSESAAE